MFCSQCGNQLQNGDSFCKSCGTQQDISTQQSAQTNKHLPIKKNLSKIKMGSIINFVAFGLHIIAVIVYFFVYSSANLDETSFNNSLDDVWSIFFIPYLILPIIMVTINVLVIKIKKLICRKILIIINLIMTIIFLLIALFFSFVLCCFGAINILTVGMFLLGSIMCAIGVFSYSDKEDYE